MERDVRTLLAGAVKDLRRAWRSLAITDLVYKAIAFAILTPAATLLLYSFRAAAGERVVADVDIARFLLTTPAGIASLLIGTTLIVAITAVELACLMAIGLGCNKGVHLDARAALEFGAANAFDVLRLISHMVVRLIGALAPFLLAAGLVYFALLDDHDINYYLSRRPPEFVYAAILGSALGVVLAGLLLRTIARWSLSMPLMLFEGVHPRRALGESARRVEGSKAIIIAALAAWVIFSITLAAAATWFVQIIGRLIAPQLAGSLALLLLFIGSLIVIGGLLALLIGIVNISLFPLIVVRCYLHLGHASPTITLEERAGAPARFSGRAIAGLATLIVLGAIGFGLAAFLTNRSQTPVAVIAHRGASATAPENTLAAFRLAAEQGAAFIELDVQESADGDVVVVHDADLMKIAGDGTKIWEGTSAHLRSIDVGSQKAAQYSSERVPTLAEALAVCRDRCRVIVELKSYGHAQRLEERVVQIVEAAGMADRCIFMSLDHGMVGKLKSLRPSWRVGLLIAKAMGDVTELDADFLAVEARMATRRFVRRAHAAGQDVFVWTVNDPAWMLVALSRGIDGLITDKPDLAKLVIERREGMSETQRFLVAQLIRLGATTQALEAEDVLRP